MGDCRSGSQRQPRHHRQNRGKCHRGDDAVEHFTAHQPRQVHSHHIAAAQHAATGIEELRNTFQQRSGADANDEENHQVHIGHCGQRHRRRDPRLARIGHGEKAHQQMRRTDQPEGQAQPQ